MSITNKTDGPLKLEVTSVRCMPVPPKNRTLAVDESWNGNIATNPVGCGKDRPRFVITYFYGDDVQGLHLSYTQVKLGWDGSIWGSRVLCMKTKDRTILHGDIYNAAGAPGDCVN